MIIMPDQCSQVASLTNADCRDRRGSGNAADLALASEDGVIRPVLVDPGTRPVGASSTPFRFASPRAFGRQRQTFGAE